MKKVGISDLIDVIRFGCRLGVDIAESFTDDGKITWTDAPKFMDSLSALPEAVIGSQNVLPELKDIDGEELEQIKNVVIEEMSGIVNIENKWFKIAEEAIKLVEGMVRLYLIVKEKNIH